MKMLRAVLIALVFATAAMTSTNAAAWWGWGNGWDGYGDGGFSFGFSFGGSMRGWGNGLYHPYYGYPYYGYPYYGYSYYDYPRYLVAPTAPEKLAEK